MDKKCVWCGQNFETDDVELDYCSMDCFYAEIQYEIDMMEADQVERG